MLFGLAIEPLAECIRSHPGIYGYNTRHTTNKISLYANDVLIYITNPLNLLSTINKFGTSSGYRINVLLIYLFQTVPLNLPKSFFKKLDSTVTNFIWDYIPTECVNSLT
jgi:hypothetical protein